MRIELNTGIMQYWCVFLCWCPRHCHCQVSRVDTKNIEFKGIFSKVSTVSTITPPFHPKLFTGMLLLLYSLLYILIYFLKDWCNCGHYGQFIDFKSKNSRNRCPPSLQRVDTRWTLCCSQSLPQLPRRESGISIY